MSLAAALALPLDFPLRDLILFLTFSVILVTLVVQGLTLPALIRRLRFEEDDSEEREEVQARLAATHAALDRLEELAGEDWTRDDTVQRLRPVRVPPPAPEGTWRVPGGRGRDRGPLAGLPAPGP